MTDLNITALTGFELPEAREKLLDWFANSDNGPVTLMWGLKNGGPVYVRMHELGDAKTCDWPDLDLNLMHLIVEAMTEEEQLQFERSMHRLYWNYIREKDEVPSYMFWLVTEGDKWRFVAAILALNLGREREETNDAVEANRS